MRIVVILLLQRLNLYFFAISRHYFTERVFFDMVVTLPLCIRTAVQESLYDTVEATSSGGGSEDGKVSLLLPFTFGVL